MSQDRPPAPDGLPLLGNSVPFARDPFGFTADAVAEVGDVFRIDLPVGDRYIVAHPDHAEQVLVSERDAFRKTDDFGLAFGDAVIAVDGEAWREQREFLDPFFFARRIQGFLPTMRERSTAVADALADGDRIELLPEMKRVTFDILASTLLGLDPDAMSDDLRIAADDLTRTSSRPRGRSPTGCRPRAAAGSGRRSRRSGRRSDRCWRTPTGRPRIRAAPTPPRT
jgi:cytochrome P450